MDKSILSFILGLLVSLIIIKFYTFNNVVVIDYNDVKL